MDNHTQSELEEPESSHPALSILSILRTVWKRKVRIALVSIPIALAGFTVVRLLPAVYVSEALVLIDTQKIPEKFVSATVATDLEDRIEAIRQTLLSGGELKKVIEDFGLYKKERKAHFEEEILEMMRKDITITLESAAGGASSNGPKRTAAFRIGFQGSDPVLVMRVANRLTDLYVDQNSKTREGEAEGTSEFLDVHLVEEKKRLDELEAKVSAYKLQHNGELPQQEASLASSLSRMQSELEANRDAINRAQQTKVILDGNLNAMEVTLAAQTRSWEQAQQPTEANESFSLTGQPGPAGAKQKKTSEVMQDQLALLLVRYPEAYPDVIRLRADIEKVKSLEKERQASSSEDAARADTGKGAPATGGAATKLPAPHEPAEFAHTREQVAGLKAQIQASDKEIQDRKAEQAQILRDLDQAQHRMEKLPVREQEMAQITRDYEISKENYKSLLDKRMAAEMSLDMERRQQSERFTVVDRAQLPEKPIKPKRPALYAGAVAMALVLGLVAGFAAELRCNVFLGEWELPEGTPVLARLPYIEIPATSEQKKSPSRRRWFSRRKGLANVVTSLFLVGAASGWLSSWIHRL
jgi:polysaccharide biosynthesis transport protein